MKRFYTPLVAGLAVLAVTAPSLAGKFVYWTEDGVLMRSAVNGTAAAALYESPAGNTLWPMACEPVEQKIYFVEAGVGLRRADGDGGNPETLVDGAYARQIAFDTDDLKVYWADSNAVMRADYDGANVEEVLPINAFGIALDLSLNLLYLTVLSDGTAAFASFNLDGGGSDIQPLFEIPAAGVSINIELDLDDDMVYWNSTGAFTVDTGIYRAKLNGNDLEQVVDPPDNEYGIWSLDLDLETGQVYWPTYWDLAGGPPRVQRADFDGAGVETVVSGTFGQSMRSVQVGFFVAPCGADTNGDSTVEVQDLMQVILDWGACPDPPAECAGDVNDDGIVDVFDLIDVVTTWGPCP